MSVKKKKYTIKKFSSFKEAEEYELEEQRNLSYEERLSILLSIVKNTKFDDKKNSKRHKGFYKLAKRKRC